MSDASDPFERFLQWLKQLLAEVRKRVDELVARIVLTLTPGTGV